MKPLIGMWVLGIGLAAVMPPAWADKKSCETLKTEIENRLQGKGVNGFALDIVAADKVRHGQRVVGTCDGGTRKIVYTRLVK